jgi:hypothetical protein
MFKKPESLVIERIHELNKTRFGSDTERYDKELTELVDEFGVDFVSQHACDETLFAGQECPPGRCERPGGYSGPEDGREYTCREACLAYIECFIGVRCTN